MPTASLCASSRAAHTSAYSQRRSPPLPGRAAVSGVAACATHGARTQQCTVHATPRGGRCHMEDARSGSALMCGPGRRRENERAEVVLERALDLERCDAALACVVHMVRGGSAAHLVGGRCGWECTVCGLARAIGGALHADRERAAPLVRLQAHRRQAPPIDLDAGERGTEAVGARQHGDRDPRDPLAAAARRLRAWIGDSTSVNFVPDSK